MRRWPVLAILLATAACKKAPAPEPQAAYVDPRNCAACHAAIAKTYRETAMAQAFYKAGGASVPTGRFNHAASGQTYEIFERDGQFFQSRSAKGFDGQPDHHIERRIDYVMGSGRHARSFIHRTPQGRLVELPLGWYAENGGTLAMSPGYDRSDPLDFRRKVSFDCFFCHNAYPAMAPGADQPHPEPVFPESLPEGIDCQRCHGPGSAHIAAAGRNGAKPEEIRAAIVNPARLGPEKSMEICMQCHLETTSRPLPNSLVRFGRGAFSYRPGEPLADFVLHFDHAKGTGRDEKFEIVNSVYRLRQSRCFLESNGKLGCTTCHNPHDIPRGDKARATYSKACQTCHATVAKAGHPSGPDCAGCHMPRRRTEDVVHAVMTDHKIMRRPPPGNLQAPTPEKNEQSYQGEVVLYYPPSARDQELYLAVAQVAQKSNPTGGIPRLEALPKSAEPRVPFALAQAYAARQQWAQAEAQFREAINRDSAFVPARKSLADMLHRTGRGGEAVPLLEPARAQSPSDPGLWYALGLAYRDAGRGAEAIAALEKAIEYDADFPEAHNSLGGLYMEKGDGTRAEAALKEALRHQPTFAEAQGNLGQLFAAKGDYPRAEYHLRNAIRRKPDLLTSWVALGEVQAVQGRWPQARQSYAEALRLSPGDQAALLGMGTAQAASGDTDAARASLAKAAAGANPALRAEAQELLNKLR